MDSMHCSLGSILTGHGRNVASICFEWIGCYDPPPKHRTKQLKVYNCT